MPHKTLGENRAFSMIELSVVILIIGVLIGGILAAQKIISKFRINTAQTLTISSPINGIADSTIWLESSLDKSFKENENSDTTPITAWYDIRENVDKNNAIQSDSAHTPTYSNTINNIHAVKFDGTSGYLNIANASFLNNSNYTIFVLESRESNKSNNYFIGDSSSGNESTTNHNLTLGYSAEGTVKHSQSSDNIYTSSISNYASSNGKPRIFSFVHDKSVGKKTYINGLLAATSTNTDSLTGMTSLKIGNSYQGQLGEIVMFARALTAEERQSIEDYLAKKWSSKILRDTGSNITIGGSCVGGTVSNTGCQKNCPVSITGVVTTSVSDGSGQLSCDTSAHYSSTPTIPYNCSNGELTLTGAVTSCSTCLTGYDPASNCAGCTSGFTLSSGLCVPGACTGGTISDITVSGNPYKLHVFSTVGTLSCPATKNIDYLIVAGGGGGGYDSGGGGGGGGLLSGSTSISSGNYAVTVGSGGSGAPNPFGSGSKGNNSTFNGLTSIGGGIGGGAGGDVANGIGGSGGGGRRNLSGSAATASQGYDGGYGGSSRGGGGGGAGGVGVVGNGTGYGGNGAQSSITGSALYYAGGGGGGVWNNTNIALGGSSVGGNGGVISTAATVGMNGRGGGGGGGGHAANTGGGAAGGSGVVIIRYPVNQ